MKYIICLFTVLSSIMVSAQATYSVAVIPEDLLENANSVVQKDITSIEIESLKKMTIISNTVITVLNKNGNRHVVPFVGYDEGTKVRGLEVKIYDEHGEEIEKIKKSDFLDISAVDGVTLYSDDRIKLFQYTPDTYPYTVHFTHTVETSNTAFIPAFAPTPQEYSSIMDRRINISYTPEVTLKHKTFDLNNILVINEQPGKISAQIKNVSAAGYEELSPEFDGTNPYVLFSLDEFYLKGVRGRSSDWNQFGKWMYGSLLDDVGTLTEETNAKIRDLVAGDTSIEGKAKKVYQYVQDHTRYISVQIGIGGWKPTAASEVDKLGYGDCKGLTNYTKALLDAAGVSSFYTVVYAGNAKKNIQADFASMQGNHVILAVPTEDDTLWLECTSQSTPFGFIGDFTDDRDVLMITPDGGKIAHTSTYENEGNLLMTEGVCKIDSDGNIAVDVNLKSQGLQYNERYRIETDNTNDKEKYYRSYWDYVENISFESMDFKNDKDEVLMTETISFNARSYATFVNEDMILNMNVLNRSSYIPKRYKTRTKPLYIERGYIDKDSVVLDFPEGYALKSIPEPMEIESIFGTYRSEILQTGEGTYVYERKCEILPGKFPKEEYDNYRKFRRKIAKNDKQKVILTKQ